jgi:hypothetical protein
MCLEMYMDISTYLFPPLPYPLPTVLMRGLAKGCGGLAGVPGGFNHLRLFIFANLSAR